MSAPPPGASLDGTRERLESGTAWRWLLLCCGISGGIALACYLTFGPLMGDSRRYLRIAENLLRQQEFSASTSAPLWPELFRAPLYPLFLAVALAPGWGVQGAVALQWLLYAASLLLIHRMALRVHGDDRAADLAVLVLAVHAPVIRWMVQVDTEAVMLPLLAALTWLVLRHLDSPRLAQSVLLGLVAGAVFLLRTDYILVLLAAPILACLVQGGRARVRRALLVAAVAWGIGGGWMLRNALVVPGHFRPLGVGGGMALWVRSVEVAVPDPEQRERVVLHDPRIRTLHDTTEPAALVEADRSLMAAGVAALAQDLPRWLGGAVFNIGFRNWVEHRDRGVSTTIRRISFASSASLLALGLIGLARLWGRPAVRVLAALILCVAPIHALLITEARYTVPLRPLLYIPAAWALAQALRWGHHWLSARTDPSNV
jgi:hypothetical protein